MRATTINTVLHHRFGKKSEYKRENVFTFAHKNDSHVVKILIQSIILTFLARTDRVAMF